MRSKILNIRSLFLFFGLLPPCLFGQVNYTISNAVVNGDYKAQNKVELITPSGHTSASGSQQAHLFIDKTIPTPASNPIYNWSFPMRALDKTLTPGSIPASYNVDGSGAFNYQIPIQLPPGTNGMMPDISLAYNSNGGDNEIGIGWAISGLSAITRVSKDNFHEGIPSGIEFNATGPFALDGNRLVSQGLNGSNQNYFYTENETFSRVTFIGPNFEVKTKGGITMIYGGNADSRLTLTQGVAAWYLSRTIDNFGNYVDYTYSNVGNEIVIKEIKYTGNANASILPYNSIKFFYDLRRDVQKQYYATNLVERKLVLREIDVYGENSQQIPVSTYNFLYTLGDFNYLSEITYSGMNGEKLNSTAFTYGNTLTNYNKTSIATTQLGLNHDFASADFNGDGLSDIIDFQYNPNSINTTTGYKTYDYWYLQLNSGNGFPTFPAQTVQGPFLPFTNANNNILGLSPVKNGFLLADISDDPAPELIYSKDANGSYSTIEAYTFDNSTNQMVKKNLSTGYPNGFTVKTANQGNLNEKISLCLGDFDGNGKSELISLWTAPSDYQLNYMDFSNNFAVFGSASNNAISVTDINNTGRSLSQYRDFTAYDFDGNGISELVGWRGNVFVVIKVTASAPNYIDLTEVFTDQLSNIDHAIFGDYNGDGKPDFITQGLVDLTIFYNTGSAFVNSGTISGSGQSTNVKLIAMDINADGKTDLLKLDNNSSLNTDISACYGGKIQDGFVPFVNNFNFDLPTIEDDQSFGNYSANPFDIPMFEVGDYNGDSFQDLLLKRQTSGTASDIVILSFNTNYNNEKYITRVVDGNDNEVLIDYASLPQLSAAGHYFKTSVSYPTNFVFNRTLPLRVVSTMTDKTDGVGMIDEFNYYNLLMHSKGRGILGFDKLVKKHYNPVTLDNYQSTDEYGLDLNYIVRTHSSSKNEFLSTSGNKVYNTTTYNNTIQGLGSNITLPIGTRAQRYFQKLNTISTVNNFINSTTNVALTYDLNGNITNKQTDIGPGKQITQEVYSNFVSAGSWIPNTAEDESTTVTRSGESPYTRSINYAHSLVYGSLITSTQDQGTTKMITTSNGYDPATGVLTNVTITAPNDITSPPPAPKITSFSYDSKFRFVEKTFLPLSYVTEIKHEPVFGNPIYSKDASGLVTLYTYDNFGSLTEITQPDNSKIDYFKEWFTASDPLDPKPVNANDAQFINTTVTSEGVRTAETLDRYGRLLKTETNTFNNGKMSNLVTYDNTGQVSKVNGPYLIPLPQGKTIIETTNTYRPDIGELISSTVSDGVTNITTTKAKYFNTSTKETSEVITAPDGKTTTNIVDETGLLTTTVDNAYNWLQYEYHYNGNYFTNKTTFNSTTISTTKSDNFHDIIESTEPNTGTKTYVCNTFGQLKTMVDNKGTNHAYSYDLLDRLTQEMIGADYYDYAYNNSGLGLGLINSVTASTGPSNKYTYDNLQRLTQLEEIVDGRSYLTKFDYDNFSRINKHTYPNNFYTTYEYANGELTKIKSPYTSLWELNRIDNSGAINRFTLADGGLTDRTFDNFGYTTNLNINNVQDLSLIYNRYNGNLTSVTDNLSGSSETYTFDALNRLTAINNNNYLMGQNMTYDAYGNITSKFDAGTYTYNGNKINQATQATNSNVAISLLQQDVTYNLFNKPTYLAEGINSANIFYGPGRERNKTTFSTNNSLTKTRYYLTGYEKNIDATNGTVTEINYVEAPTGLCAMNVTKNNVPTLYCVHGDHLGSIVALTDAQGNITARQDFDAWGRRRNATNNDYANPDVIPDWLYRGFTTHEHLPQFDLVNMNGRLYDPKLGRMLSADPLLSDPTNSQAYNKYTYANNNPLIYTDPSGNSSVFSGKNLGGFWGQNSKGYGAYGEGFAGLMDGTFGAAANALSTEKTYQMDANAASAIRVPSSGLNSYNHDFTNDYISVSSISRKLTTTAYSTFDEHDIAYENYRSQEWEFGEMETNTYFMPGAGDPPETVALRFTTSVGKGVFSFGKGLFTGETWSNMRSGLRNTGNEIVGFIDHGLEPGYYVKKFNEVRDNNENFWRHSTPESLGFGLGYSAAGIGLGAPLGFFAGNISTFGLGEAMWQTSLLGPRSYLFGRFHSRYVPFGRRGILNKAASGSNGFGIGWSNVGDKHVFRVKVLNKKLLDIYKK